MFGLIPAIVKLGFIAVICVIIYMLLKNGIQWHKNNNAPVLTVNVKVVAKRMAVSRHQLPQHHHGHGMPMSHVSSSSAYFVTFEADTGDRLELGVPAQEYGILVEGDVGKLTFQGTRYKGFERERTDRVEE